MTSDRKIISNRRNAALSSGPRSAAGKARVAKRNALRHGLAVSILNDPATCAEAERLAELIAGVEANEARLAQARIIAEAEIDLLRVRQAQIMSMNAELPSPAGMVACGAQDGSPTPGAHANSRASASSQIVELPNRTFATSMLKALPQLLALERYERRILSRRREAIRIFRDLEA